MFCLSHIFAHATTVGSVKVDTPSKCFGIHTFGVVDLELSIIDINRFLISHCLSSGKNLVIKLCTPCEDDHTDLLTAMLS